MTAFKNLPPWSDFQKGQESDMLRRRNDYIEKLWEYHRKTLKQHSDMATPAAEKAAHDEWVRAKAADTSVMPKEPPRMPCLECAKLWN